jgi:hypothetical protein
MLCSEGRGGERAQAKGDGPARSPVKEKNFFFFCGRKNERERNQNNLKQTKTINNANF